MKNITFVTGLHGNERLPILALASIGQKQTVANLSAVAKNVRFVEKDMNASFGMGGKTLEEKRAKEVLKTIDRQNLVIDLHTFSGESEPFIILVDLKMLDLAKSLGIKNIVFMKFNIKGGHALINYRNGVSVEMGNHDDPKSFERAIKLVNRINDQRGRSIKTTFYEVFGKIEKPGEYIDFKKHEDGFYPVLSRGTAYDFFGLKARIKKL